MWGVLVVCGPLVFTWALCEALQAVLLRRPRPMQWGGRALEWLAGFLLPIALLATVAMLLGPRAERMGLGGLLLVVLGMASGALMTRWRLLRQAHRHASLGAPAVERRNA